MHARTPGPTTCKPARVAPNMARQATSADREITPMAIVTSIDSDASCTA